MFASRLVKTIEKAPRSHLVVLKSVVKCYQEKTSGDGLGVSHECLLSMINGYFVKKLAIDKLLLNQVYEILSFLASADIVEIIE